MGARQWRPLVLAVMVALAGSLGHASVFAGKEVQPPAQVMDCQVLAATIATDNHRLHQELRQVKRELALLNQNLEKPGVREIIAGIGFLFGLFGVAALLSARRRDRKED
jgi:beta-lactamase regulating signal transducer with metallopeptidase domain